MSLSWLDRLICHVHPRRIVVERRSWREAPRRHAIDVPSPTTGEPEWQPALAAFGQALAGDGKRGGRAHVIVADHYVRYALIPWDDTFVGGRMRKAVALALFRNTLGDRAHSLEIALDRPRFRRNGMAAGIEGEFLSGLRTALNRQGIRLHSLQPRLVGELAAGGKRLADTDGWFVCADTDRLTLAGFQAGALTSLRNQRATEDEIDAELGALLVAEGSACDGKRLILCGGAARLSPPTGDWEVCEWPSILPEATGA